MYTSINSFAYRNANAGLSYQNTSVNAGFGGTQSSFNQSVFSAANRPVNNYNSMQNISIFATNRNNNFNNFGTVNNINVYNNSPVNQQGGFQQNNLATLGAQQNIFAQQNGGVSMNNLMTQPAMMGGQQNMMQQNMMQQNPFAQNMQYPNVNGVNGMGGTDMFSQIMNMFNMFKNFIGTGNKSEHDGKNRMTMKGASDILEKHKDELWKSYKGIDQKEAEKIASGEGELAEAMRYLIDNGKFEEISRGKRIDKRDISHYYNLTHAKNTK